MHVKLKRRTDITVESFAYVAIKLAQSLEQLPLNALYEQVLGEAEKHRSALRLMHRDVLELANSALGAGTLREMRLQRKCGIATKAIERAHDEITRIASQYAPQKLAA